MKHRYVISMFGRNARSVLYWYEDRRRWLRDQSGATLYASHIGMEQDLRYLRKKYRRRGKTIGFSGAQHIDPITGFRVKPAIPVPVPRHSSRELHELACATADEWVIEFKATDRQGVSLDLSAALDRLECATRSSPLRKAKP